VTARQVVLVPQDWPGFHGWEVLDDANYHSGLVGEYYEPHRFRAYGVGVGLDGGPVAAEQEFSTCDEAVEWIIDGFPRADA
jgi:hypothetical protein